MNNFPIYLVFRSDKINISVDEMPAKFQSDLNILRTNLAPQQVPDLTTRFWLYSM